MASALNFFSFLFSFPSFSLLLLLLFPFFLLLFFSKFFYYIYYISLFLSFSLFVFEKSSGFVLLSPVDCSLWEELPWPFDLSRKNFRKSQWGAPPETSSGTSFVVSLFLSISLYLSLFFSLSLLSRSLFPSFVYTGSLYSPSGNCCVPVGWDTTGPQDLWQMQHLHNIIPRSWSY